MNNCRYASCTMLPAAGKLRKEISGKSNGEMALVKLLRDIETGTAHPDGQAIVMSYMQNMY